MPSGACQPVGREVSKECADVVADIADWDTNRLKVERRARVVTEHLGLSWVRPHVTAGSTPTGLLGGHDPLPITELRDRYRAEGVRSKAWRCRTESCHYS